MTTIELIEGKVALLLLRVGQLERDAKLSLTADELTAQELARHLGFNVSVVLLPAKSRGLAPVQKRQMAFELSKRGWGTARIARVLRVCERSVERWTSPDPTPRKV